VTLVCITRTAELSIVALSIGFANAKCVAMICFKLEGPFPFSLTGSTGLDRPAGSKRHPIFISQLFDTTTAGESEFAESALKTLQSVGHELIS
jgi:hypothetical protein